MTATAVLRSRPRSSGSRPADGRDPAASWSPVPTAATGRAAASQIVLHQLVRRELRLLAELATWAEAGDAARSRELTRHGELVSRVLLHHHAVERDRLWPTLQRALPYDDALADCLADWRDRCAGIDSALRDVTTAARQWTVAGTPPARDAFALACLDLADAVDAQTAEEERTLLPLLSALDPREWTAIARSAGARFSRREELLVLGLALEDACAGDRRRLLSGLPPAGRAVWRLYGAGRYRAAVVRLRGAPPAA
jgi:Hemerythrin HHE cation binding domain